MPSDSMFVRDDDNNMAIRVVSNTGVSAEPDSVFTRDEDGNVAMRVTSSGGGGGGGSDPHNLGWYATQSALETAHPTATAGDWAIVGSTDTVWIWDTDNSEWVDSDQKGQVTSVNGQTGAVTVSELPSQTGKAGKFLITDGTDASWGTTIQDRLNITLNSANTEFMRFTNQNNVVMQLQQFSSGTSPQFAFYWKSSTSSQQRAIMFQGTSVYPNQNDETLGKDTHKWDNVYTTKINNGADITVPNQAGTMVVADSTSATAGQVLTLDNNLQPVWQAGGSGLPTQTGNAGKFLITDGTDASWSDKPLVNETNSTNAIMVSLQNNTSQSNSTTIGAWATNGGQYGTAIGTSSGAGEKGVALGADTNSKGGTSSIAIGYGASTLWTNNAILLNASGTAVTNSDANTFKVANANGNYEMMSANGTIPTDRLTKVNTTITLTAAGWSSNTQTVNVTGMTATGVVFPSPDPADQSAYTSAGILCTAQAAGTLTFTCDTVPSADIDVNVVML